MNTSLLIAIVAIEGAGLLITLGFGIAAYKAAKKAKQSAEEAKAKAGAIANATERFFGDIKNIIAN